MKHKLTLYIFPLIVLAFFTCNSSSHLNQDKGKNDNKSKLTENANPYFPVAENNKWEYINQAPREETELFSVEVQNVKGNNGSKYFDLNSFPFFSKENKKMTLEINDDGEIITDPYQDVKMVFIPKVENLKNGYSWSYGEWNGSVSFLNDTITTENGVYTNCVFLNFSISITFGAEIWLAKDVGIVKWGYFRTNPPTFNPTYYVLKNLTLSN